MSIKSKKNISGKQLVLSTNGSAEKTPRSKPENGALVLSGGLTIGGGTHPRPYKINPESKEDREKRLAKRKALTIRMLQTAYENHHGSKAS